MMWKNINKEKPADGQEVLISNGRCRVIGWWAQDWQLWCKVGSRDIIVFDESANWWHELPGLPNPHAIEKTTIFYGGTKKQVEKQLTCDHEWHGPCIDSLSRYYKCMKCYCQDRDCSEADYYDALQKLNQMIVDLCQKR